MAISAEQRPAQRLVAADGGIGLERGEGSGGDLHRGAGVHVPVGDQHRPRSGVEEGPRQPRQRLAAFAAGGGVARRHDHPVGVELELGHVGRLEQAVVLGGGLVLGGRRHQQRRFGAVAHEQRGLARHQPVGGEVDRPRPAQGAARRQRLDLAHRGPLAEIDRAVGSAEVMGHGAQFVGGLGQGRRLAQRLHVGDGAAIDVGQRRRRGAAGGALRALGRRGLARSPACSRRCGRRRRR